MDVVCQAAATSSERATAQMMSALDFWFLMGTIQWMVGWSLKKKARPQDSSANSSYRSFNFVAQPILFSKGTHIGCWMLLVQFASMFSERSKNDNPAFKV